MLYFKILALTDCHFIFLRPIIWYKFSEQFLNTYYMQGTILDTVETTKMKKTCPHSKRSREWVDGGGWHKNTDEQVHAEREKWVCELL